MSSDNLNIAKTKLFESQRLLIEHQMLNDQEAHCILMLNEYREAIINSTNDDERNLFHNLRASVFLELKKLRDIHD